MTAFLTDAAFIGRTALALAVPAALWQMTPYGTRRAAYAQAGLLSVAFAVLVWLHLSADFGVAAVFNSVQNNLPWYYRVSASWSHHEGSMLLWLLLSSLCGALMARGHDHPDLRKTALRFHACIGAAFGAFLYFTSDPFRRLPFTPSDGADLNPMLQDPGLIIHPPLLYLGYVACGGIFAVAAACAVRSEHTMPLLRRYAAAGWLFLSAGIIQGSAWAYYELGWGGYWFWDPVENAALIPWLIVTALIHALAVRDKQGLPARQSLLCAFSAFIAALIGTFLVRSGSIVSVHAFAADPTRGVFILSAVVGLIVVCGLLYLRYRSPAEVPAVYTLPGLVSLNNVLLGATALTVLVGTLYPMLAESLGAQRLSVGSPYFAATAAPLMLAVAVLIPIAILLPRLRDRSWWWRLPAVTGAACAPVLILYRPEELGAAVGIIIGGWVIGGTLLHLLRTVKSGRRLMPAMWAAHIGFGLLIWGITGTSYGEIKSEAALKTGQSLALGPLNLTLTQRIISPGANYAAEKNLISVTGAGADFTLAPERRLYLVRENDGFVGSGRVTSEAAISNGLAAAVYVNVGSATADNGIVVRAYLQPLTSCLRLGAWLMLLGGAIALYHRVKSGKAVTE